MFYGDTIQETRQIFFSSWDKFQKKLPLSPLEHQVIDVLVDHPEYHHFLNNPEKYLEYDFNPQVDGSNPFLHLGLHLAIREQIATNRPQGIKSAYLELLKKYVHPLEVEHLIMQQLADFIWLAQKNNLPPDENKYLKAIMDLCN